MSKFWIISLVIIVLLIGINVLLTSPGHIIGGYSNAPLIAIALLLCIVLSGIRNNAAKGLEVYVRRSYRVTLAVLVIGLLLSLMVKQVEGFNVISGLVAGGLVFISVAFAILNGLAILLYKVFK